MMNLDDSQSGFPVSSTCEQLPYCTMLDRKYQIMVGYVEDELAKRVGTSTTVFHGPIQMNFNASS